MVTLLFSFLGMAVVVRRLVGLARMEYRLVARLVGRLGLGLGRRGWGRGCWNCGFRGGFARAGFVGFHGGGFHGGFGGGFHGGGGHGGGGGHR